MIRYLAKRISQSIVVIFGVTIIAFGVMFMTGDPTTILLGDTRGMTQEQIAAFRHEMGFDRPWIVQYASYMAKAVQGDLGVSLHHRQPTVDLLTERLPATLKLTTAAMLLTIVISIPVGVISATRRNSWIDQTVMGGALLGQSLPVFWLGIMLILIFGVKLRWLPISGASSWKHLILPAITLGTFSIARNARMVRSSMLECLSLDYVRTARSKGLSERAVIYKHALKNALIPVVTLLGMEFAGLLGGAVITETIFAWPGVGRLAVQAIYTKDFPLVQATVIMMATVFVALNILVDMLYTYLDPRVRFA